MCDHGADINTKMLSGMSPMIYAARKGYDDIAMYLSLRSDDIDLENEATGNNVFTIYLKLRTPPDILRMKQLLCRGADINFCGLNKLTPLHTAINLQLSTKTIKFLIK